MTWLSPSPLALRHEGREEGERGDEESNWKMKREKNEADRKEKVTKLRMGRKEVRGKKMEAIKGVRGEDER